MEASGQRSRPRHRNGGSLPRAHQPHHESAYISSNCCRNAGLRDLVGARSHISEEVTSSASDCLLASCYSPGWICLQRHLIGVELDRFSNLHSTSRKGKQMRSYAAATLPRIEQILHGLLHSAGFASPPQRKYRNREAS